MKILFFDFEPDDREKFHGRLLDLGHEGFFEENAEDALARIGEQGIRIVVAEGRLPRFAWSELVRRLREDPRKPYVYVILREDGETDDSHEEWAAEAGVDDFISGPEDGRELRRRLRVAGRIAEAVHRIW